MIAPNPLIQIDSIAPHRRLPISFAHHHWEQKLSTYVTHKATLFWAFWATGRFTRDPHVTFFIRQTAYPGPTRSSAHSNFWYRFLKSMAKSSSFRQPMLVGINEYPDPANRLEGCVNDVYAMSATLQENGFSPEDITVVLNERATKENIIDRLHWLLSNCDDQTDRVFYYSGHGLQIPGRGKDSAIDHLEDGIVPVDFDWQKLNAITDRDFLDLYSQLPKTSRFLAIFDSCFSGGDGQITAGWRSLPPVPESLRHAFVQWDRKERRWVNREFKRALPGVDGQEKAYSGQNGCTYKILRAVPLRTLRKDKYDAVRKLRNHEGPFLPVVLEACGDDQPSFEYPDGATIRGAFTLALTDVVKQAGPGGMNLTFKKLMEATKKRLTDLRIDQQPQLVGPKKVLSQPIAVWGAPNQTRRRKRSA